MSWSCIQPLLRKLYMFVLQPEKTHLLHFSKAYEHIYINTFKKSMSLKWPHWHIRGIGAYNTTHVFWVVYLNVFSCVPSLVRSSITTTMVIDSKSGEVGSPPPQGPKKSFTDDLHSTFSSPLAWILVLALIITWSCVFVIMFDLMDYKTISGTVRIGFIWHLFKP